MTEHEPDTTAASEADRATAGERECGCPGEWVNNGGGHMCPAFTPAEGGDDE